MGAMARSRPILYTIFGCAALWLLSSQAFVNPAPCREVKIVGRALFDQEGFVYNFAANRDQTFWNDVGYLPDGTSFPKAGNAIFRPDTVDPHQDGSPLPPSKYVNDIGYFPDGTPIDKAGNAIFRQ